MTKWYAWLGMVECDVCTTNWQWYLQQKIWQADYKFHGSSRLDMLINEASWADGWSEWAALMMMLKHSWRTEFDDQCWADWQTVDVMGREDEQLWCDRDFLCDTSILYCKSKLVLLLRLGYLKPFLAGSKKTRQGPGCRAGALHISRCWFSLTVVAEPKLI